MNNFFPSSFCATVLLNRFFFETNDFYLFPSCKTRVRINKKKSPNTLKCLAGCIYTGVLVYITRTLLKQLSQQYPPTAYHLHCGEDSDDVNRVSLGLNWIRKCSSHMLIMGSNHWFSMHEFRKINFKVNPSEPSWCVCWVFRANFFQIFIAIADF